MPYKRVGKSVYKKVDGWEKVGTSKTKKNAKRYYRVLLAIEHGWRPKKRRK